MPNLRIIAVPVPITILVGGAGTPRKMTQPFDRNSDLVGILASGLCIVHCAVAPVIFAARPLFGGHEHVHQSGLMSWESLDFVFLALSLVAVIYSASHTRLNMIKAGFWSSWVLFALGIAGEHFGLFAGDLMMYAGSLLLVGLHLSNYLLSRAHNRRLSVG